MLAFVREAKASHVAKDSVNVEGNFPSVQEPGFCVESMVEIVGMSVDYKTMN